MKIPIPTIDERFRGPMVRITALLCMLLFLGFVLADHAVATVKPPVNVKLSTDFVAEKGGPHVHVGKKGEVVNIKIEISSGVDMENAEFDLLLPEGWEFVGGQKNWKGKLQKDGNISLKATVRIKGDAFGVIEGRVILPEACTSVEGILDLRDPATTDRVPEFGIGSQVPADTPTKMMEEDVPEINEEPEMKQLLPESSLTTMDLQSNQKQLGAKDAGENVQDCSVRATGRLGYRDDYGTFIGYSGARVILWDSDVDWDDECARGITDWNGNFDLTGSCGDPFGGNPDIYIQVYAANSNYVQVGDPYTWVTTTRDGFCGTYNFGTWQSPTNQHGAWQLYNQGVQGNKYIDIYDTMPPIVYVTWPAGGSGNWYNLDNRIFINSTWFEPAMYHEYGHFIMDKYADIPDFDYCNGICDGAKCGHCLWSPENGYIHWMEGWPDFFADVLSRYWNRNDVYNFESHVDSSYTNRDMIEGFTAAILWDIHDPAQDNQHGDDPRDTLSLGFDEIWNVTTNYDPGGTYNFPMTIHQFWNGFYSWYPGYRAGLWNIYAEHHIIKPCPIPTPFAPTLVSPANGATGVVTTPLLNWNDVANATSYEVQVSLVSSFALVARSATVATSQWTVSPALSVNTLYYWRVRAKNTCGTFGSWSAVRSFRTCSTPSAPTLVSPANYANFVSTSPLLNWNDVSGATSYEVQVSLSSTFGTVARSATVATSQWTVSPALSTNTVYYWRVRAKNVCGTVGPWSVVWNFKTCSTPSAPTLVSPANGATGVSLSPLLDWNNVAGATAYQVQVSLSSTFATIARSATVTTSQWTVSPALSTNTIYYWRVRANNACGTVGPWSVVWNFKTCSTPFATKLVSPANYANFVSTSPLLNWNDVSGATSYEVQVSLSSTFATIARSATVAISQWTVSPALGTNTVYYWRVRAKNACGIGPWSLVWKFSTTPICLLPATPTLVSPANGATGVSLWPTLDWNDASGATSYDVQVSYSSTFATIDRSATVTTSSWKVSTALGENQILYWRVRSKNVCGNSSWSSIRSFRTTIG